MIKVLILSDLPSLQKMDQSRVFACTGLDHQELYISSGLMANLDMRVVVVYKIASISILAAHVLPEVITLFRFVFHVQLVVFEQLVRSMSELASVLVRTDPQLHKTATQL